MTEEREKGGSPQTEARLWLAQRVSAMVLGVAVIVQARHFCMCYRGVRQPGAWTTTSKLHGVFLKSAAARMELFTLIGIRPEA